MASMFKWKKNDSKKVVTPPAVQGRFMEDSPLPPTSHLRPILDDKDEQLFQQLATQVELPPPLPPRQSVITDDGQETTEAAGSGAASGQQTPTKEHRNMWRYWHYIPAVYVTERALEQIPAYKRRMAAKEGSSEQAAASPEELKALEEKEATKEKKEMTNILNSLNLEAVNNRVVSLSAGSQKLLERFNQILKDIINGVPTAYDDLEKFLTQSQGELDGMYDKLPAFLQTLVKSLPTKMYSTLAPEFAAAAKLASMASGKGEASSSGAKQKKKGIYPSLKNMIVEKGAVAAMLRSILNFLKLRFPAALASTNVLVSLAVFLLLFVFWYCHKRGREVRLEKEAGEKVDAETDDTETEREIDEAIAEEVRHERAHK